MELNVQQCAPDSRRWRWQWWTACSHSQGQSAMSMVHVLHLQYGQPSSTLDQLSKTSEPQQMAHQLGTAAKACLNGGGAGAGSGGLGGGY